MNPEPAITIELFTFCAGEMRLGIIAMAVERVIPVENSKELADCPHIVALLELHGAKPVVHRRMVDLTSAGRTARLIVDGPIRLARIGASDLVPIGLGLRMPALLGFATDSEQLVLLLDINWLMERASAYEHQRISRLVELRT